jgi:hypothetical protein
LRLFLKHAADAGFLAPDRVPHSTMRAGYRLTRSLRIAITKPLFLKAHPASAARANNANSVIDQSTL